MGAESDDLTAYANPSSEVGRGAFNYNCRQRKYTDAQLKRALALLASGKSYGQVQKMTGISKSTLIRAKRN